MPTQVFLRYLRNLQKIMNVLIKQARIICSGSPFNGQIKDILIVDGIIQQIADTITENAGEVIANDNLHVSIGWMDIFANFNDPGFEHKETLETGAAAAAAGGFTDILVIPNSNPVISTRAQVEYIIQRSANLPVHIYPIGAVTKNAEGKELSEMYDMHASGAIAFSDGNNPLQNPGVLLKALQYILPLDAVVLQLPHDKSLAAHGLMNEGIMSTRLGLPGIPAIAEELMIARDIELLKYTGSKLHITGVSTRKGIQLIKKAKEEGLKLTASVTPYHCYFCDKDLEGYDSNLKVIPVLGTKDDMMAVREALASGVIDCLASHHQPQHWDDKTCEFEYAKNGMIGLETLFGVINGLGQDLEQLIKTLTVNPREIFNIPIPDFATGSTACLTLFDPAKSFTFQKEMIHSKSFNTPFIGKQLKGKVIGIINKNKTAINPS